MLHLLHLKIHTAEAVGCRPVLSPLTVSQLQVGNAVPLLMALDYMATAYTALTGERPRKEVPDFRAIDREQQQQQQQQQQQPASAPRRRQQLRRPGLGPRQVMQEEQQQLEQRQQQGGDSGSAGRGGLGSGESQAAPARVHNTTRRCRLQGSSLSNKRARIHPSGAAQLELEGQQQQQRDRQQREEAEVIDLTGDD